MREAAGESDGDSKCCVGVGGEEKNYHFHRNIEYPESEGTMEINESNS